MLMLAAYHTSDLGFDEAESLAEVTSLLERAASNGRFGGLIARMVSRRYYDALTNHTDENLREQLWRDFFVALNAFLALNATGSQTELDVLRSIVAENADLLPHFVEAEALSTQSLGGCANLENAKAAAFDRKARGAQLPLF
jgi:hypothetical protein